MNLVPKRIAEELWGVILLVLSLSSQTIAQSPANRGHAWGGWNEVPKVDEENPPGLVILGPDPLGPSRLIRYGQYLTLSEDQQLYLAVFYERYQEHFDDLVSDIQPRLHQAARDSSKDCTPEMTLDCPRHVAKLARLEGEAVSRLRNLDGRLFTEMESVLSERQKESLPRVKKDRSREVAWSLARTLCRLRPSTIDVHSLLEELVLTPEEMVTIDPNMQEGEDQLTPMLEQLEQMIISSRPERAQLDADLIDANFINPQAPGADEREAAAVTRYLVILTPQAALQRKIADLNDALIRDLVRALPADRARQLRGTYQVMAYRLIYPDRLDVHEICEQVSAVNNLPEESRITIRESFSKYQQEYEKVCIEMESRCKDMWEFQAVTRRSKADQETHGDPLRRLRRQRWTLDTRLINQVKSSAYSYLSEDLQRAIDEYLSDAKEVMSVGETDGFPFARRTAK